MRTREALLYWRDSRDVHQNAQYASFEALLRSGTGQKSSQRALVGPEGGKISLVGDEEVFKDVKNALEGIKTALEGNRMVLQEVIYRDFTL